MLDLLGSVLTGILQFPADPDGEPASLTRLPDPVRESKP